MVYIVQVQKIWKIKYRQNKILLWGVLKLSDIVSQLLFHEQFQTCSFIYANLKFHLVLHYISFFFFHNIFSTTGINTNLKIEIVVNSNFLVANK